MPKMPKLPKMPKIVEFCLLNANLGDAALYLNPPSIIISKGLIHPKLLKI
jgi:hypothetical protein